MTNAAWITFAADVLERADERLRDAVTGLDEEQLRWRPGPEANPIGWLAWHVTRVLDDHMAALAEREQVYPAWAERFDAPYPVEAHGFGMSTEEVGAFSGKAETLLGYWSATLEAARGILADLPDDPDRVVDRNWDPPVTLEVRLVSVVDEVAAHSGQIGYVRGLLDVHLRQAGQQED